MKKIVFYVFICLVLLPACSNVAKQAEPGSGDNTIPLIPYTTVHRFAHDTSSFTEGLLVHNGQLFESTGHTDAYPVSRSLFGAVDTVTGKILVKAEIDKQRYFGEGIVFLKGKVYQLTDTTHIGFIYDAVDFKKLGEFHYEGDGWALTADSSFLIMSNGSSNVVYRNPETLMVVKTLNITDNNGPVSNINELELINGSLYANQWLTDYILKIDTANGRVVGKLDFSPLAKAAREAYPGAAEMNGIAFDPASNKIFVTGKLWPFFYQVNFSH